MSCRRGRAAAHSGESPQQELPELLQFDLDDLVRTSVIAFRYHPHINNVMTHICRAQWDRIEQALYVIFNPVVRHADLSPLAVNIVELLDAERGTTGRILKPYFHSVLAKRLSQELVTCLSLHIADLYMAKQADLASRPQLCGKPPD